MRSIWMAGEIARARAAQGMAQRPMVNWGRRYTPPGMTIVPPSAWAYSRGDLGQAGDFLGIGKLVHKVLGGTVGNVLKAIPGVGSVVSMVDAGASVLAGSKKRSKTSGPSGGIALPVAAAGGASLAGLLGGGNAGGLYQMGGVGSIAPDDPGIITQTSRNLGITTAEGAPQGYHLNKTGYWVNGSDLIPGAHYVAPRTKWVKNRKRNPFNPRAASRSMSRLAGLSHGMKALERNLRKLAPPPRHHTTRAASGRKR